MLQGHTKTLYSLKVKGINCMEMQNRISGVTHHLHNLHFGIQAQMVEKHLQVLLHLDGVVIHLGYSEDSHLTLPPHLQEQKIGFLHQSFIHF